MDNAPSGASSISRLDGRWEMEARWALKVVRMAGDWKEPLYTWYPLVCVAQRSEVLTMLLLSVSSMLA